VRSAAGASGARSGTLRGVPRDEPPQTARTARPTGAARRSSRRPAQAPTREGPPGWLAFILGAALTLLAYGALREDPPKRTPVKTATNAMKPSAYSRRQRRERTDAGVAAPRTAQPALDPRATIDAAIPFEELAVEDDHEAAPAEARASRRPDAGAHRAAAPEEHPALPPGHPGIDEPPPPEEPPAEETTRTIRRVEVTVISRWQQPGMCEKSGPAAAARRNMMARFQRVKWEPNAILFLDPRLPFGSQRRLVEPLENAEREVAEQLDLHPSRPDVFAYRDTRLLLAGGCTNDNVVAYYDGDLHVVATHADVQQSITHEYTHHALMTSGLVAPAWAQEGIAMNVARETWWQTSEWLDRVAARPFTLDIMERTVPYTMTSEQSLAFYVQAAAMVWCSTLDDPEGLRGLVRKLQSSSPTLDYELPPLADPSSLRACSREILEAASEAQ